MGIKERLMQAALWLALIGLAIGGLRGNLVTVALCAVSLVAASAWLIFQDGQRQVDEAQRRAEGDEEL